jgi:hypothetical protein
MLPCPRIVLVIGQQFVPTESEGYDFQRAPPPFLQLGFFLVARNGIEPPMPAFSEPKQPVFTIT